MKKTGLTTIAMFLIALCVSLQSGFAKDVEKKMPQLTMEQRQKMAESHEKLALCLRSDKTQKECHDEMMKSCETMGKDGCPMMGMGHHKMKHHEHEDKEEKK